MGRPSRGDPRCAPCGVNVTLRLRLALIYGLFASLALTLALLAGYGFYERAVYRNIDGLLQIFADQNAARLRAGTPLELPRIPSPVALRIFDMGGRLLDSVGDPNVPAIDPLHSLSNGVPAHAPWIDLLPQISPTFTGPPHVVYAGLGLTVAEGGRWRGYIQRLSDGRLLQIVTSIRPSDQALKIVRRNFLGLAALGTLLVMFLGLLLTGPSLHPLVRLVTRARELTQTAMPEAGGRIPSQDELSLLADTLSTTVEHLKKEQERLELALGAAQMGWWEWDVASNRHRWSPEFERLLGLEPGSFRGGVEAFLEHVYPDDRARVEALVRGDGGQNRPPTFEYRVPLPGSGVRWVESRAQVYRDRSGSVLRLLGLDLDITKRKRAEGRLAALARVTSSLAGAQTLAEVHRVVLGEVLAALGANGGALRLLSPQGLISEEPLIGPSANLDAVCHQGTVPLAALHPAAETTRTGAAVFLGSRRETLERYPHLAGLVTQAPLEASAHLPLKRGAETFAALSLSFAEPRDWDEAEQCFALALADRAAVTYERARLFEEARLSEDRAVQLQALTVLLSAAPTLAEVVSLVFQYGLVAVGASAGTVALLSADRESLEILETSGDPPELVERCQRFPLSLPTPLATAVRRGEAEWVGSPQEFTERYGHPPRAVGSAAWAALPLLAHGKPVGGLGLTYTQPRAFDPGEQTFLLTLAEVCAGALERSRLFEAERVARERAETLQRVAAALAAASTPQEVAEAVTREGSLALGARRSGLYLTEGELLRRVDTGDTSSELRQVPLGAPIPTAEVVRDEEPRWIRSREDFLRQYPRLEAELGALGAEAAVSLPVRVSGRAVGSLNFIFDRGLEWDEGERGFVQTLAALAGQALERTSLFASLTESEARFRQLAETIPQLAWMADVSGYIFWYNRRWYEYTGTTPEEMEGWGWQKVHDPEVLPRVLERWRASIESGQAFDMTFPLRGADGVFRPFLTRVEPLKDAAGRVARWFGTNTDVTEQMRREQEAALLAAVGADLSRLSAPDELMAAVAERIGSYLRVLRVYFARLDEQAEVLEVLYD